MSQQARRFWWRVGATFGVVAVVGSLVGLRLAAQNLGEQVAQGSATDALIRAVAMLVFALAGLIGAGGLTMRAAKQAKAPFPGREILDALERIDTKLELLPGIFAGQAAREERLIQMMAEHEEATKEARKQVALLFDRDDRQRTRSTDPRP